MIDEITLYFNKHLLLMILVLTRLSMLMMSMPAIGTGVPKRVRAMLALLLTYLITPTVIDFDPNFSPQPANNIDLVILIGREAMVGLFIGAVLQFVITGVQTAGEIMTGTGGMQLGDSIDPMSNSTMPSLAQLIGMMVVAVMILIGGHRMIIGSLLESFQSMPPGRVLFGESMMSTIVSQFGASLATGIRVSAPVVVTMLLCNLITGYISRTLPQLSLMSIGLSVNALALLTVVVFTIGSAGYVFQDEFASSIEQLSRFWEEYLTPLARSRSAS